MIKSFPSRAALLLPFFPNAAHACTVCDSAGGQALRAGIFDGHFIATLAKVVSPVPALLVAVAVAHLLTAPSFPARNRSPLDPAR